MYIFCSPILISDRDFEYKTVGAQPKSGGISNNRQGYGLTEAAF